MSFIEFMVDLRQWGLEYFGKYYGPYRARVLSNADPHAIGRIRVECKRARLADSPWILPMMQGAGAHSGEFWPPEKGDLVWIYFDNGNPETPACYHGGWFASGDLDKDQEGSELPGEVDKGETTAKPGLRPEPGKPPVKRGWMSPGGHRVVLDDTAWKKNITITTNGNCKIILDDEKGKECITIEHPNGKILKITAEGKVKVGNRDGSFEPMMRGSTVKKYLEAHTHPHAYGPTGPPMQPFPPKGLSEDSETS